MVVAAGGKVAGGEYAYGAVVGIDEANSLASGGVSVDIDDGFSCGQNALGEGLVVGADDEGVEAG
ncbi:MAG: hypothetical protein SPK06_02135 [Kiritimatiellia bacterium]|nr:hypothetical protein [Kiritimatiellia bacterium]